MPSRRAVLAVTGVALSSGCIAGRPGCRYGYIVDVTPVEDVSISVREPEGRTLGLVETILDEGSTEVVALQGATPLREDLVVEYDGVYYQVQETAVSEREIPAMRANARYESGVTAPENATVIAFGDLPEVDRRAIRHLVAGPGHSRLEPDEDDPPGPRRSLRAGDVPIPYWNGTDDSRLVAVGEAWIVWGDRHFDVEILRTDTMTEETYRYELDRIGETREALVAHALPEDPVALDPLPPESRAIVDEAIEGEYETCETEPQALETLRDHLGEHHDGPGHADWYVEYQDEIYGIRINGYEA